MSETATLDFMAYRKADLRIKEWDVLNMVARLNTAARQHERDDRLTYDDLYLLCEHHARWTCVVCGQKHNETNRLTAEYIFKLDMPNARTSLSNVRVVCQACSRIGKRQARPERRRAALHFTHINEQGEQRVA